MRLSYKLPTNNPLLAESIKFRLMELGYEFDDKDEINNYIYTSEYGFGSYSSDGWYDQDDLNLHTLFNTNEYAFARAKEITIGCKKFIFNNKYWQSGNLYVYKKDLENLLLPRQPFQVYAPGEKLNILVQQKLFEFGCKWKSNYPFQAKYYNDWIIVGTVHGGENGLDHNPTKYSNGGPEIPIQSLFEGKTIFNYNLVKVRDGYECEGVHIPMQTINKALKAFDGECE